MEDNVRTGANLAELRKMARNITTEEIPNSKQRIDINGNPVNENLTKGNQSVSYDGRPQPAHLNVRPTPVSMESVDTQDTVGSFTKVEEVKQPQMKQPVEEPEYEGPGLVVNKEEYKEKAEAPAGQNVFTGVNPDTQSAIDSYLKEIEEETKEVEERIAERGINPEDVASGKITEAQLEDSEDEIDDEAKDDMTESEFKEKYENVARVIIDKSGFGQVINFTEEEHAKMERVKKIRVEEVETVSLKTLKTKKAKKNTNVDKIIKRISNSAIANIVLPSSGYSASVRGLSTYELITLQSPTGNNLLDIQSKWAIIYDKIEETSIGKFNDFNDFLSHTSSDDYGVFIYGLLCATYPEMDKFPMKCEKCGKTYDHDYSVQSLLRVERMSEELQDAIANIVDSSVMESTAKECHENSPVFERKIIKLPGSGVIAELQVQSAYDLINRTFKDLDKIKDEKYATPAILSTRIHALYVPDPDTDPSDPEYFEFTSTLDIAKTLYAMDTQDVYILNQMVNESVNKLTMEFGFMNVECPSCHNKINSVPIRDIESFLFYKYRQVANSLTE